MRVPRHLVEARQEKLARILQQRGYLPIAELCEHLEISEATARRDLEALARAKKITRTYGGAIVEAKPRFASFQERQLRAAEAKRRIAFAARQLVAEGSVIYLDVGTTIFAIAELLRDQPVRPLTVVTSSLPVGELLANMDGISVHLLGGELLPRQSALLGPMARRVLPMWKFDLALLSAEGVNRVGIWNTEKEIVTHQRAVMRRARKNVFCVDAGKLGQKAAALLMAWNSTIYLLTDATSETLRKQRIILRSGQHLAA